MAFKLKTEMFLALTWTVHSWLTFWRSDGYNKLMQNLQELPVRIKFSCNLWTTYIAGWIRSSWLLTCTCIWQQPSAYSFDFWKIVQCTGNNFDNRRERRITLDSDSGGIPHLFGTSLSPIWAVAWRARHNNNNKPVAENLLLSKLISVHWTSRVLSEVEWGGRRQLWDTCTWYMLAAMNCVSNQVYMWSEDCEKIWFFNGNFRKFCVTLL